MFVVKRNTIIQHLDNVNPTSSALAQPCTNVIQMFCVYWVRYIYIFVFNYLC